MRLPETRIKQAILHPEGECRETAVRYFTDAHLQDNSVMPLVIEAIEKYGGDSSFRMLRDAERLPQTEATVDWLVKELQKEYDRNDLAQDNHRFAVALILYRTPPTLLSRRLSDILAAPGFPDELRDPLIQRLDMLTWDWDRGWSALKHFGVDTMRRNGFTNNDIHYAHRIIESLARHRKHHAETVLDFVEGDFGEEPEDLLEWLLPCLAEIAGEMRLEQAVPALLEHFQSEDLHLGDSAASALSRLGSDSVIVAIDALWWDAEEDFRCDLADVLYHLRGDLCVEQALAFLPTEESREVQLTLVETLLSNFATDAIDVGCEYITGIEDDGLDPEERDLRYWLVAAAMIMGTTFPRFEEWRQAAIRDNWGWFDIEPRRLADAFKPDQPGPKSSGNGKDYPWRSPF